MQDRERIFCGLVRRASVSPVVVGIGTVRIETDMGLAWLAM